MIILWPSLWLQCHLQYMKQMTSGRSTSVPHSLLIIAQHWAVVAVGERRRQEGEGWEELQRRQTMVVLLLRTLFSPKQHNTTHSESVSYSGNGPLLGSWAQVGFQGKWAVVPAAQVWNQLTPCCMTLNEFPSFWASVSSLEKSGW